jgi:hypothetical protein
MRLIKINAPVGYGQKIIDTAFSAGISKVSVHQVTNHTATGETEPRDVVDIETSTPIAKGFVNKLLAEEYFDQERIGFSIRQPRTAVFGMSIRKATYPICEPSTDLYEELWQFSHITYGLVIRIFISAGLLAFGMIESKVLLMIGGLLFLPVLPMVMSISYGVVGRQPKLAFQGLAALAAAAATLFVGGVLVAAMSSPPLRFDDIGSLGVGIIISAAVGIAAQLAAIDDAGRRELIGLAAASQIGLIPVWLGIVAVFGIPSASANNEIVTRFICLVANLGVLILAIMATQYATGAVGNIRKLLCS